MWISGGSLAAQEQVQMQIDALAASLVEQINRHPEVNTVAVAAFTDHQYKSNSLHRYLSDELATALVMNPNRKFIVINRSRLDVLLAEAKLDADGLMDPTNLPRLGRLNGTEMVIGALVRTATDYLSVTVQGIEVATTNALVAGRQSVTFIPSLRDLVDGAEGIVPSGDASADSAVKTPQGRPSALNIQQFKILSNGCRFDANTNQVLCDFEITNEGATTSLSIYGQRTEVFFQGMGAAQGPQNIDLDENNGRQRVSAIIRSGETVSMVLAISTSVKHTQIARMLINCHAQDRGIFNIELHQLSIQ